MPPFAVLKAANGQHLTAIGQGIFSVATIAVTAFVFADQDLASNLLGLIPFANAGCTSTFKPFTFHVFPQGTKPLLCREPVRIRPCYGRSVPSRDHHRRTNPPPRMIFPPLTQATACISRRTRQATWTMQATYDTYTPLWAILPLQPSCEWLKRGSSSDRANSPDSRQRSCANICPMQWPPPRAIWTDHHRASLTRRPMQSAPAKGTTRRTHGISNYSLGSMSKWCHSPPSTDPDLQFL
jgi:hypothetical protein